jgi:hypothetical protein
MQALYSDQLRDLDDGYGVKYETAAEHETAAGTRTCSFRSARGVGRVNTLR